MPIPASMICSSCTPASSSRRTARHPPPISSYFPHSAGSSPISLARRDSSWTATGTRRCGLSACPICRSPRLTYRFVQNGKPDRITLQATNPEDADKFAKAMGNNVENFAFVDYDGQVTVGFAEPANTTTTVFAGYNRVAANDLLTAMDSGAACSAALAGALKHAASPLVHCGDARWSPVAMLRGQSPPPWGIRRGGERSSRRVVAHHHGRRPRRTC